MQTNKSFLKWSLAFLFWCMSVLFTSLAWAAESILQIKPAPLKMSTSDSPFECSKVYTDFLKNLGQKINNETWIETTANDGKPLFIDLAKKESQLFLTFFKTKEGVWAEGNAEICPGKVDKKSHPSWIAKITKSDITVGSKAPWPVKLGFSSGAKFELKLIEANRLKISTFGWSGEFVPSTRTNLKAEQSAVATPSTNDAKLN